LSKLNSLNFYLNKSSGSNDERNFAEAGMFSNKILSLQKYL